MPASADDEPTASVTATSSPGHQHQVSPPSQYATSLAEIRNLSAALSTFLRRHDDLHHHLQSLHYAVDSNSTPGTLPLEKTPITAETLTLEKSPIDEPGTKTLTLDSQSNRSGMTEIEMLCATGMVRDIRRYISTHLSSIENLRETVPRALKMAQNPALLVLNSFGRFFLQGIKAYDKASPMIPARRASLFILECYLLMDREGIRVDEKVKKEAEKSALDWRKRLIAEGGLDRVNEIDGRGLLLLIGCFGVPKVFTGTDIKDLILASNLSEIKVAIQRSSILLERVPAIIEEMMKKKKDYKVADIIYSFGMENKYPPQPILASFVQESTETWNKAMKAAHGSLAAQRDASKKHLADLRSVMRRLKDHKLNIAEILPDCPLTEKIATLEKEVTDLNKKIGDQVIEKRRSEPKPVKRSEHREDRRGEKRARFPDHMPRQYNGREYLEGRIFPERLTPVRALDGAFPGNLYRPPYEIHRPLPEIRGNGSLLGERPLPEIRSSGGLMLDAVASNGDPYRWREDALLLERVLGERAGGQRYPELSPVGVNGLFRQTTSLEGFNNPLGIGSSNRTLTSNADLYQFADAVAERTLYGAARDVPAVPRHPSYNLY